MSLFGFSLIPRNERFIELLVKSSEGVKSGAETLLDLVADYRDVESKVRRMRDLEHAGDEHIREVFDALNRSFLTPFDREDIAALATSLDNMLDAAEEAAQRLNVYRIEEPTESSRRLARIIAEQARAIHRVVPLLEKTAHRDDVWSSIREIHQLEKDADAILSAALGGLFAGEHSVLALKLAVQWSDVYQTLERATDCAERVAVALQTILVKAG
jgi:predicted phosphate transport protein (TIGR00153 family)